MTETTTISDKDLHTSLTTAVRKKDRTTATTTTTTTTTRDITSTCREKVSERSERSGLAAAACCSSVPSLTSSVRELLRVGRQPLGCGHLWGHVLDDGCHGDHLQVRQEEKLSRTSSHPQRYKTLVHRLGGWDQFTGFTGLFSLSLHEFSAPIFQVVLLQEATLSLSHHLTTRYQRPVNVFILLCVKPVIYTQSRDAIFFCLGDTDTFRTTKVTKVTKVTATRSNARKVVIRWILLRSLVDASDVA